MPEGGLGACPAVLHGAATGGACHTRAVSPLRCILAATIVLGVLAMVAPAASLAGCTGSAGDTQYVDPLAGCHKHKSSSTQASTTPSAATTTPSPSTPPAVASAATSTTPTATTATGATGKDPSSKTLPYTGFQTWEAAGLGLVLLAGGFGLRRRTQGR